MKNYKYYSFITGIFVACLLISNILDTKLIVLFGLVLPTGILLFPINYLFGDILTEVYGYGPSRKVIWTGFISLIIMGVFLKLAEQISPAPFWKNQEAFVLILGKLPRIIIASVSAFFIGEFMNSLTLAKLKVFQKGKSMSFRFALSTIVGQAVDTTVFVSIAFIGSMPSIDLIKIIFSAWLVKVSWEIIALPITIPIVKWLKKVESEDYFDTNTNFNPFKF